MRGPRAWSATIASALLIAGCAVTESSPRPVQTTPKTARPSNRDGPGLAANRVNGLRDTGVHASLTNPPDSERARARELMASLLTGQRGPKAGYDRDQFGPSWTDNVDVRWGHNGCSTREDILRRDLRAVIYRPGTEDVDGRGCVVLEGLLHDPYTGRLIEFSKAQPERVQIDHVVPLYYAWQLGAARWTPDERRRFANDPLNLLAVDGPSNMQKNASGPAAWLPPNKAARCGYAVRFALVARKYRLPITVFDRDQMTRQCAER
jgi:Protein of unknown function (DUF1524)